MSTTTPLRTELRWTPPPYDDLRRAEEPVVPARGGRLGHGRAARSARRRFVAPAVALALVCGVTAAWIVHREVSGDPTGPAGPVAAVQRLIADLADRNRTVARRDLVPAERAMAGASTALVGGASTVGDPVPTTPAGATVAMVPVEGSGAARRVAVELVAGRWSVSLVRTVAAEVVGEPAASPEPPIAAVGAASADDAVRSFLAAVLAGRPGDAVGLVAPDDLGAVHDYGRQTAGAIGPTPAPVTVVAARFDDRSTSAGLRVGLRSVDLVRADGTPVTVSADAGCLEVTVEVAGDRSTRAVCGSGDPGAVPRILAAAGLVGNGLGAGGLPALVDMLTGDGVLTTQLGAGWFVDPLRGATDPAAMLLTALREHSLPALIGLARPAPP